MNDPEDDNVGSADTRDEVYYGDLESQELTKTSLETLNAWMKGCDESIESGVATDLIAVCPVALRAACEELIERRADAITIRQLKEAIYWALGERGDFPQEPAPLAGKYRQRYWWRTELRRLSGLPINGVPPDEPRTCDCPEGAGTIAPDPHEGYCDYRQDRAYFDGAKQASAMAHQSLKAMDDWIAGGCGNRVPAVKSRECHHDLQKPNHTICIDLEGPVQVAECTVCQRRWTGIDTASRT